VIPDACALGAAFFNEPHSANALPLLKAIENYEVFALMPVVGISEFLNICRKNASSVSAANLDQIIWEFLTLPVTWISNDLENQAMSAWRLHRDFTFQTNDAFYFHAAKRWNADLCTIDHGFIHTAGQYNTHANTEDQIGVFDLRIQPFTC
jgi:predicted nucleic acid-binding protein